MTFKCNSTSRIVALLTLLKSHFGQVKRKKMISQCPATTRKVALLNTQVAFWVGPEAEFSTSTKSYFGMV